MSKNKKELSQVKARQTKLGKKSNEELIQIVLKKDKIERSLNNQIKNLKGEVNHLSTRVKNFDSDMEGTMQTLESYKDKCRTLQEKNDSLKIEYNDVYNLYTREHNSVVKLVKQVNTWNIIAGVTTAIAVIAIIVAVL